MERFVSVFQWGTKLNMSFFLYALASLAGCVPLVLCCKLVDCLPQLSIVVLLCQCQLFVCHFSVRVQCTGQLPWSGHWDWLCTFGSCTDMSCLVCFGARHTLGGGHEASMCVCLVRSDMCLLHTNGPTRVANKHPLLVESSRHTYRCTVWP